MKEEQSASRTSGKGLRSGVRALLEEEQADDAADDDESDVPRL